MMRPHGGRRQSAIPSSLLTGPCERTAAVGLAPRQSDAPPRKAYQQSTRVRTYVDWDAVAQFWHRRPELGLSSATGKASRLKREDRRNGVPIDARSCARFSLAPR